MSVASLEVSTGCLPRRRAAGDLVRRASWKRGMGSVGRGFRSSQASVATSSRLPPRAAHKKLTTGCSFHAENVSMDPIIIPVVFILTAGVVGIVSTFGVALLKRLPSRELGDAPRDRAELEGIHDAIADVNQRLERVEEERDFYKDLLDSPEAHREISPPAVEEDASDIGPA